jgi:predicted small secreted protein
MFSFSSVDRAKRFLSVCFVLLVMAAVTTGCTDPNTDVEEGTGLPQALIGKWATAFDSFEITRSGDTETIKYDDGGYGFGWVGTIRFVSNFNSRSGVIIIQYTSGAPNASKPFHAVYYLNFTPGTSVELNNTYDVSIPFPGDNNVDTATLSQAIIKFTSDNMSSYMDVAFSTPYSKQ